MRFFSLIALASFPIWAAAAPLNKRDLIWFTVTEEVIETVVDYVTQWVPAGDVPTSATSTTTTPLATTPAPGVFVPVTPTLLPAAPSSTASSTTTLAPVLVVSPPLPSPSSTTSTTTSVTPANTSPAYISPAYSPPAYTPPVVAAPVPASTSTSIAPAASPAAPAVSPVAPAAPVSGASLSAAVQALPRWPIANAPFQSMKLPAASVSNDCTPGSPCSGDMTFYNPSMGAGACGPAPNGYVFQDSDPVVAVAVNMMGSESNGDVLNPLCGRYLSITNPATGKSNTAMVVDKCYGCPGNQDIDLSPSLFNSLGLAAHGRYSDVEWYWL
ncbi:DNA-directed RNA polymerase II subunit RPB1 [Lambiella insularis]|nr:DNA-directed RNA polymerase II subunit RPB1 [Lambiella insularis]